MGRSRKARRRAERARARRAPQHRSFSVATRLVLILGGLAAIAAGVLLVVHGTPETARRLTRLGGILIILGLASCVIAVLGSV